MFAADVLDTLRKSGLSGSSLTALSEDEIVKGLKEALAKGVEHSVTNLGRVGGYLNHTDVKIPMPDRLARVEKTLRAVKQEHLADEFVATMNRAAELAVPEAATIFSDAIRAMTLQDAKSLLSGPEDAATQYFRKVSAGRLEEKMLPVVKKTTETAGVTASYKQLMEKASPTVSIFNIDPKALDLDQYVATKAVDGLFKRIADEEKTIRQNPAARTTQLLKKVFNR